MKKHLHFFGLIKKGQVVLASIAILLVIVSSIVIDSKQAKAISGAESIDYSVVVDAGHGGLDPGSIGYKTKTKESEINLSVAKILQKKLKEIGFNVIMTRDSSAGLYGLSSTNYKKRDMQKRRDIIEETNPDMVISIHMNSFSNHTLRGAQVFYDKDSEVSEQLALSIQNQFEQRLEKSNKGISIGDYYMLKCTKAPSVITECGFLSNVADEQLLIDSAYQEKIADCIFVGIVTFLNFKTQ